MMTAFIFFKLNDEQKGIILNFVYLTVCRLENKTLDTL